MSYMIMRKTTALFDKIVSDRILFEPVFIEIGDSLRRAFTDENINQALKLAINKYGAEELMVVKIVTFKLSDIIISFNVGENNE